MPSAASKQHWRHSRRHPGRGDRLSEPISHHAPILFPYTTLFRSGAAFFARLSGAAVSLYDRDGERAAVVAAIVGAEVVPAGDGVAEAVAAFTEIGRAHV